MKFQNPIIPGFAPDPSVILVKDTFFLVTSTFHIFPALPIYASKDLNHWVHISNAINRPSQLDLSDASTNAFSLVTGDTMIATAGLFAPTIRYHKGTFYIVCTNTTSGGVDFDTQNFYITTEDIFSNEWSDPVFIDFNGIDPNIFFDVDDRAYIQGSWRLDRLKQPSCTIKQFEIDIKTGKSLSETKEIWEGFAKIDSEGPHIYFKDGWYYLLIAEGGTFEYHMLSVARSKNVWGPYESCPHNPIMTSDGKPEEYIQNIGHGELFQDTEGKWWAVVLGVRNESNRSPLGRETFLTPVTWLKDEWPQIEQPKITFERTHPESNNSCLSKQDERVDDCYIRTPVLANYKFSADNHIIELRATAANPSARIGTTSFLGKRQRSPICVSTASLVLNESQLGTSLNVGLCLYKDDFRFALIYYDYLTNKVTLNLTNKSKGPSSTVSASAKINGQISFKIQATENAYGFFYQEDGVQPWARLGEIDSMEMTARDFTGTMMGLFATGKGEADGSWTSFMDFKVVP